MEAFNCQHRILLYPIATTSKTSVRQCTAQASGCFHQMTEKMQTAETAELWSSWALCSTVCRRTGRGRAKVLAAHRQVWHVTCQHQTPFCPEICSGSNSMETTVERVKLQLRACWRRW